MNSVKLFLGGLAAIISMGSVSPAFARPAFNPNNGYSTNNGSGVSYGYNTSRAHFDKELEGKILALVNDVRYRKGLGELSTDNRGAKSARLAAKEAGIEGGFGSIDNSLSDRLTAQGLDLSRRAYGETRAIIDEGDDLDLMARQIVKHWLKNAKFSKVLLNDEVSYAGVAAYVNNDGEVMVVLNAFGAERQPAIVQPQPPRGCGGY